MYIVIIGLLIIAIVAFLIWWFFIHTKGRNYLPDQFSQTFQNTRSLLNNANSILNNPAGNLYNVVRSVGVSIPTANTEISNYGGEHVLDQNILLKMATQTPPHPTPEFTSRLRNLGNHIIGDLVIPPRREGVSIPYNSSIDELKDGYFQH